MERFALGPREKMEGARLALLCEEERLCLWPWPWLLRLRVLSLEREREWEECLLELRWREEVEGAKGYRKLMPRLGMLPEETWVRMRKGYQLEVYPSQPLY